MTTPRRKDPQAQPTRLELIVDEEKLDTLAEGCQLIGYDWRYLYVNRAAVEHARAHTKGDLIGHTLTEKYPGVEDTEMYWVLRWCARARMPQTMVNEFRYLDGTKRWFHLRITPVTTGLFIVSEDITARRQSEDAIREYIDNLEEMIFMISHKVRQPVCTIRGLIQLYENHRMTREDLNRLGDYLHSNMVALDSFTRELTEFIHRKKEEMEACWKCQEQIPMVDLKDFDLSEYPSQEVRRSSTSASGTAQAKQ